MILRIFLREDWAGQMVQISGIVWVMRKKFNILLYLQELQIRKDHHVD